MQEQERSPLKVVVIDKHDISRLGIRRMLESMKTVCEISEAKDAQSGLELVKTLQADLVLMDIALTDNDAIELTRQLKETLNTRVILLSSHKDMSKVFASMLAGAQGYCLKNISMLQLESAINSAINDGFWLTPELAKSIAETFLTQQDDCASLSIPVKVHKISDHTLSERELEVLGLLVAGLSNQEMAVRLKLSCETIKTHMRHIMDKLRVSDRTQAAVKAVKLGLLQTID